MKLKLILAIIIFLFLTFEKAMSQKDFIEAFKDKRGNVLSARIDKKTRTAKFIYGLKDSVRYFGYDHHDLNQTSILNIGQRLFSDYEKALKVQVKNLRLKKIDSDGEWHFVEYQQTYGGIPVHGSSVGFSIGPHGEVASLGADAYPDINIGTNETVNSGSAVTEAKANMNSSDADLVQDPEIVILPIENDSAFGYHLVWKIHLESQQDLKNYFYFVSATDGRVLRAEDHTREGGTIKGTISGFYWPVRNTDATATGNFQTISLVLRNNLGQKVTTINTDANGYYNTGYVASGWYTLEIPLQDNWIKVQDANPGNGAFDIKTTIAVSQGTYNYSWIASDGTSVR